MPKLKILDELYDYGRKPNCAHSYQLIGPIDGDDTETTDLI